MPGEIDPRLLQFLVQKMGPNISGETVQGFMLGLGAQNLTKMMKPKGPPTPKQPQAGGQVAINKQVPGQGPLRSGTRPDQLQALAQMLSNPQIGQQIAKMPAVQPRMASPQVGIPGVPGPTFG